MSPRTERNLSLYVIYAGLRSALFWLPVFFLYFSQHLTLSQVLQLEAIYYVSVVIMEVPSGYFSDSVGRKPTLLISSAAVTGAHVLFYSGSTFAVFCVAQVLLAVSMAFNSGTDTSLHYDSLKSLGRQQEFDTREARIGKLGFRVSAVAAALGGFVAMADLRHAYALSALAGLASVIVVLMIAEPLGDRTRAQGVWAQLRACRQYLSQPILLWLFGMSLVAVVLNHVPYELYQSYTRLLQFDWVPSGDDTPLVSGLHTAAVAFLAASVAGRSIRIRDRIGLVPTVLASIGLQTVVILVMGWFLHPLVLLVVLARGVPRALMTAPVNAAISHRVDSAHRATYLSLMSFCGRLAFSGFLALLSVIAETDDPNWETLSELLRVGGIFGLGAVTVFAIFRPRATR